MSTGNLLCHAGPFIKGFYDGTNKPLFSMFVVVLFLKGHLTSTEFITSLFVHFVLSRVGWVGPTTTPPDEGFLY